MTIIRISHIFIVDVAIYTRTRKKKFDQEEIPFMTTVEHVPSSFDKWSKYHHNTPKN